MYHQVTAYDNVIAYAQLYFVFVDMEAMINYLADRKLWNAKGNLMSCVVQYMPSAVP